MSGPRKGDRVGSYLLEEPVGTGSFGQVWRARHHMFDEEVAVKIPTDVEYIQNLRREGVTIHGLRHPNIVRAIDLDPFADPAYLVMEYVSGDSLRALLSAYPGGLPVVTAQSVLEGVLAALSVAHQAGVIHRDIKPANILLTHSAAEVEKISAQSVKVADFGLGHVCGETMNSIMQSQPAGRGPGPSVSGTLAYMSPEQREGVEIDGRSDLYSCGIVLFEMLTGSRPHGLELPSTLRSDVPASLDKVFEGCYARLERRFANVTEALTALSRVPAGGVGLEGAMRRCRGCLGMVGLGDQYCIHCGESLVEFVPRCRSCQAFVHASDRFCIFCGHDLRRVQAS